MAMSDVGVLKNVGALGEAARRKPQQAAKSRLKLPVLGTDDDPLFPTRELDMIVIYGSFHVFIAD